MTKYPAYDQRTRRYSAARARRRRARRRRAAARMAVFSAFLALASALALCGGRALGEYSSRPKPEKQTVPAAEQDVPAVTETEPPMSAPEEIPPEEVPPEGPVYYDFGVPLSATEPAEDSRFEGAVFVGDSRTEGLELFGGLGQGEFLWHRGLCVFDADDEDHQYFTANGQPATLLEALGAGDYSAVYVMLGVNELGCEPASFERGLGKLLDSLSELQPEAVIYLETLPPVNDELVRESGLPSYVTNENIDKFNEIITELAGEKRVLLLDVAAAYRGEDGQLPAELTADGVHFRAPGYARWADYLRGHMGDPEMYFASRELA